MARRKLLSQSPSLLLHSKKPRGWRSAGDAVMSGAAVVPHVSLPPARMRPGAGFCPLPLPVRGGEWHLRLGMNQPEGVLLGCNLWSILGLRIKGEASAFLLRFQDLRFGHLTLVPVGRAPGLLCAPLFQPPFKGTVELLCQGQCRTPGSNIGEVDGRTSFGGGRQCWR